MTTPLLASKLTDARKFSYDARFRSGTPRPEAVRLKAPILSHSWSLISLVVVHRKLMVIGVITAQSATTAL